MGFIRVRRFAGAAALVMAGALALTGCGGDDGDGDSAPKAAPPAATSAAAADTDTPTPEESPGTASATPTETPTATPAATLRDYTGEGVGAATAAARASGLRYTVVLEGTGRRAASWGAGEKVCDQSGASGDGAVTFTVARDGRDCAGRLLHTPTPTPAKSKATGGSTGGSGSGGSSGGSGGTSGGGGGSKACAITSPAGNCYANGQFCAARHHGMSTYGKGGEYLTCERDAAGRWRWSDGVPG
ncbi:hypothetical protein [Streptomyces sp. BBFR109]|uniref:hypothetical protein n=1 Tax=Streptomyces sp. BBFR109 TaxID=3448172 RepID=UPI003F7640DF